MENPFSDPLHIFLYTAAALLPVANPMGLSAPFYSMTSHMEIAARRKTAWRVAIVLLRARHRHPRAGAS